jgi:hypothetical protein
MMLIKPNRAILDGRVKRIHPALDGIGADVEFEVRSSETEEGFVDFLGAKPGSVLTLFAAVPEELEESKSYRVTTSVRGGPRGERVVIESIRGEAD